MKKFIILLSTIFPTLLFAQSTLFSNPYSKKKIEADCHNMVFTRSEEIPSLKISKEAFQDSLISQLKLNKISITGGTIKYKFVVTTQSELLDVYVDSGQISKEKKLREAIIALSSLWSPGKQNSRVVCAYVNLEIIFSEKNLIFNISQ